MFLNFGRDLIRFRGEGVCSSVKQVNVRRSHMRLVAVVMTKKALPCSEPRWKLLTSSRCEVNGKYTYSLDTDPFYGFSDFVDHIDVHKQQRTVLFNKHRRISGNSFRSFFTNSYIKPWSSFTW